MQAIPTRLLVAQGARTHRIGCKNPHRPHPKSVHKDGAKQGSFVMQVGEWLQIPNNEYFARKCPKYPHILKDYFKMGRDYSEKGPVRIRLIMSLGCLKELGECRYKKL